jgi:hypothetical protein
MLQQCFDQTDSLITEKYQNNTYIATLGDIIGTELHHTAQIAKEDYLLLPWRTKTHKDTDNFLCHGRIINTQID